jgi:uncharacterized protein YecT (DUF1311 family)
MKGILQSSALLFASIVALGACSKSGKKTDQVAEVAQDTMLMHDLAEANRNTAAAAATDTTMAVVHSGAAGPDALLNGASTASRPAPSVASPVREPPPSQNVPSPRMSAPTRANDAPAPTNVTRRMTSADDSQPRTTGNPCDSPNPVDQRTCLNRSIVSNDADLNSTYRDLIAQAQRSGGSELEDRFRQAQRDWINRRDLGCRDRGTGALWARERAQCLAEYSDRRTAELRQSLNSLRGQQ